MEQALAAYSGYKGHYTAGRGLCMQLRQHHERPKSRVRKLPVRKKRPMRDTLKTSRLEPMTFTIRPMDPVRDAERVGRYHVELVLLQNELWKTLAARSFDAQETRRQMANRAETQGFIRQVSNMMARKEGMVYLLETQSREPAGYIFVTETLDPNTFDRIGIIGEIFIEEPFRGRGAGRQALAAGEKWLMGRGIESYQVFVTRTNVHAVDLYQKNGYSVYDYRMVKGQVKQ